MVESVGAEVEKNTWRVIEPLKWRRIPERVLLRGIRTRFGNSVRRSIRPDP